MNIWIWVWIALAVILSVAEIFTAGFFLLPFGIGAAVAAVLEFVAPGSIGWQWAAFVGLSSLLLVVLRRFADRVTHEPPQKVGGDRLLEKRGVVIDAFSPPECRGRVRVEREEWQADAPGCGALQPGTEVVVVAVEGTHLIVKLADEASA